MFFGTSLNQRILLGIVLQQLINSFSNPSKLEHKEFAMSSCSTLQKKRLRPLLMHSNKESIRRSIWLETKQRYRIFMTLRLPSHYFH
jgi:hypothetical protein